MSHHEIIGLRTKTDNDVYDRDGAAGNDLGLVVDPSQALPSFCSVPLKYLSLATLAIQNSLLTIIMHYSRVSTLPSQTYSAATAVVMNELLKGLISLAVAFARTSPPISRNADIPKGNFTSPTSTSLHALLCYLRTLTFRVRKVFNEVFSQDCWKLSIPAVLYVIQNHLQFVAISNLEAATFQVSYQLKILTTAAFSVLLLRKQLLPHQWFALSLLAIGVGVIQIQTSTSSVALMPNLILNTHTMNPMKGLIAVIAACFTSGLAGVYFEMVLKNTPGDIWIRNVQLSMFSLLPALSPIIFTYAESNDMTCTRRNLVCLFDNFGLWAWATVVTQVVGGLVTAMVIKYSGNILKGFATSLSIVFSFLASVALFNFSITFTFLLGSFMVLVATWLYNQPKELWKSGGMAQNLWWKVLLT